LYHIHKSLTETAKINYSPVFGFRIFDFNFPQSKSTCNRSRS